MTFEELKTALFARSNFGMKLGLDRMRAALARLGNPERCAPALHVAGTNGKGSTCAFAESALRAAGLRTGLYTSPHLIHLCERIRIDGVPIDEARAVELYQRVDDPELTFFELVTLMAFVAFAEARVDAMVIEVGLGGRLDATNVLERPAACAVAALGLEHTQYLGPTLTHIAREKAGIFKPGVTAVSAGQPVEAARVLEAVARETGAPLRRPPRDYVFESRGDKPFCYQGPTLTVRPRRLGLVGHHQRANAALACALIEASGLRAELDRGLEAARWPGRLEEVNGVWLDGAHNPHAARALARTLQEFRGHEPKLDPQFRFVSPKLRLVFGALQDKDVAAMLGILGPLADSVHYCTPDSPRAVPAATLAGLWPGRAHASVAAALEAARGEGGMVLVCGSLYLVGEARALLAGVEKPPMPSERL